MSADFGGCPRFLTVFSVDLSEGRMCVSRRVDDMAPPRPKANLPTGKYKTHRRKVSRDFRGEIMECSYGREKRSSGLRDTWQSGRRPSHGQRCSGVVNFVCRGK